MMEEHEYMNELIVKRGLKRESNRIGLALLLFLLSQYAVYFLLYVVTVIFSKDGIGALLEKKAISPLLEQVIMLCSYSVSALVAIAVLNKGQSWKFERPKKPFDFLTLPIYFGSYLPIMLISLIYVSIMNMLGLKGVDIVIPFPDNTIGRVIYLLQYALMPAFLEELLFRGVLLERLRKYGNVLAITMSSLVFALMHGNAVGFLFIFMLGLVFGYMTVISESLIPSIIMHLLNNSVALLSSNFENDIWVTSAISISIIALGIVGIIVTAVYISTNKNKKQFRVPREKGPIMNRVYNFLLTPGMIIFICATFAMTVLVEIFAA
ncbi:MAG: CPBP family intramembrane metalloprotease [Ruminococcaceae bacterium]|nr:CPBP family intramembrane metalloprotease [Oscillospiraceae bacterium]